MHKSSRNGRLQKKRLSPHFIRRLSSWLVVSTALLLSAGTARADTVYKADSGTTGGFLDSATTTPAAPGAIIQNYAEGTALTAGDALVFNNLVTAASTYSVSTTAAFNLQLLGLTVGSLFNGSLLSPAGAITISNNAAQSQTITVGASGIDMSLAGQNLTLANAATGTLTFATSANQIWKMRTGRTLSLAAVPVTLANDVTIRGAGIVNLGNSTTGNAISGAGNLLIDGSQSGGTTAVTLSGNNSAWTGAVTVGASTALRTGVTLNIDQSAASQNKLADSKVLTINHSTVNLMGTSAGTEVVASVTLGQGLNAVTRTAGTGVLAMNAISRSMGAALNIGTASIATTDTSNTANSIMGSWAVVNFSDWAVSAASAADTAITALGSYTTQNTINSWAAGQNILVNGTTTAATADKTISTLKIAHTTATTAVGIDFGANTLTLNDGGNGGGILRNQGGDTTIGNSTVGSSFLTAGAADDSVNDTLYFWNNANTMSVNSVIRDNNTGVGSDALHVFVGGSGTVTVLANNTYTGGTTVSGMFNLGNNSVAANSASAGTGEIINFGVISISPTAATAKTVANDITGTGAVTVFRGTVTLSGSNTYAGATTVGNDTAAVIVRAGSANGFSTNSRFIFNNVTFGATLDLDGFSSSLAALSGTQTAALITLGDRTLTLSGSELSNSGSAESLSLTTQTYRGDITGTGDLIKNGLYTQVFAGTGVMGFTGATTVNGGTLQADKALSTSALTINNDGSLFISNIANSLTAMTAVDLASSGATWRINNGLNQSLGSLSGVAGSLVDLQNGAGSITLTITDNGGTPTVFNGVINSVAGAGAGSVIKEGSNTWVLGGGNAFSGGLTINGGIVQNAAANPVGVFGDYVPVFLADVAGVALDINGNSAAIGSLGGGGTTGGDVTLGATGRLTTGFNNTSTNFGGVISGGSVGVETLVKVGNGTMTLSGTNTFVGDVVIRRGTGGITLSGGSALADTVNIRNFGNGSTLTVLDSETVGAVTGAAGTKIVLSGATTTLTTSYTDGTPTALAATADTDSTGGRIVKGIDTRGLVVGSLISGTSIPAGSYIVQILDGDSVLINAVPTPTTTDFAPTITTTARLASDISGTGGFTKNGSGLLFMAGNSTYSGDTTINDGTVQIGGIWTGRDYSIQDQLSDNSQFVFAGSGTQNLNFANSATNLLQFERIGSISGGSVTTSINLLAGSTVAALAIGADNKSSTFSGRFLGNSGATWLIKEGTGTFTWNNPTTDVFDGVIDLRAGGFKNGGVGGLDASNIVRISNNGATFTNAVTDTFAIIEGGAGVIRVQPSSGFIGALYGNHLTGAGASVVIDTGTVMTVSSTTNSGYNGTISGAGTLIKAGTSLWQIFGAATLTGETQITTGTLRTGVLSGSAGLGTPGAGLTGTLSSLSGLRLTGGTLDINSTAQTALRINASSSGGTIQLLNGSLTLADQNTQSTATVFTGNLGSVLNINASGAATLTLTGNSSAFAGTVNVGTNAALLINTGGNFGDAARINLNGTGTQLTTSIADTIGSLAGTGNAVLTASLTLREAGSGTASAAGWSGVTSGAGGLILSNFGGLTISGNLAHTGGITLSSNSALNLNYGAGNNIIPTTGALTLNGGTIRVVSSTLATTILESAASTALNAGASSAETLGSMTSVTAGSGLGGLNLGAITRAAGATIDLGRYAAATSTANVNGILGSTNLAYATFEGGTWAVANGAATAISGLAAFNANTFLTNQHTDITAAGANVGGTAATLRFSGANATDITGPTTLSMGGILVTRNVGANASTISGALAATGNELLIHQYNPFGDLALSNIAGTNTVITTAGGGRTLITNNMAGTGATNIGYGYLQLGDASVGGSTTGMVGTGAILNNGTLGINRSNALTFGTAVISGTGNIEQLGTGTTTLGGTNTFQGRVTIRGGTLEITNNAGLGAAATAAPNRWANLTSVNSGGTLLVNVVAGGTVTETLNLDGGTLDFRSTAATTFAGPIFLTGDSTIAVSNPGAAVNHLITGEIFANPGSDLTVTNVGGATPSTLVLAPGSTTGARWEKTTINADGRLQIGNNSRGFLGTGSVVNNGTLILKPNDGHYVVGNTITGSGSLESTRSTSGNTYFTGDLSGFTGTFLVSSTTGVNASSVAEIGNDTYNNGFGTGAISIVSNAFAGTSGISSLRTHLNQDITLANTINLTPASDGTNAKNAQLIRAGLGTVTLTGTINLGATNTGTGAQRNLIQTEGGGKLRLNGTLAGVSANNLLNIVNNNIIVIGGSVSNTYNGILSGNNVWIFDNSGTTILSGANSFNSGNTYIRQGTVSLTGGAAMQDDNDIHVLNGATLDIAASETVGALHMQRGASTNVATGQTLTVDDAQNQLLAGKFTGAGNLTLGGGNFMAMYSSVANTISGNLQLGVTTTNGTVSATNLTNALGSFGTITLGVAGNTGIGGLEYMGSGETFAHAIALTGTSTTGNYIAANGSGALILSGDITSNSTTGILRLIGQTGGYWNPIINRVDGKISDGANKLAIAMTATANDDRFGVTSHWALTNANNDFSGNITVNVGILEFSGNLGSGGAVATSQLGDLTVARTFDLGTNNFDGRRYDIFGNTDQLSAQGTGTPTNTLSPNGSIGTLLFNSSSSSTFTLPSNITLTQSFSSATNPGGGQIINNGAGAVVIQGALTSGATGSRNWILDGSNAGANNISGVISGGSVVSIVKEGAGTWRISNAANTFTGNVTINNGILELAGGGAVGDSATVAVTGAGADGFFSGTAKVRFINSETIGLLTGNILTEAEILASQTLTIAAGNSTMNGLITGAGNLSRLILSGSTAGTLTTSASNTYTGITTLGAAGTATANAGITIYQIANGGSNSGLGASSNAATNLVFTTNTSGANGGILQWQGYTNQTTDRLFTMGLGVAGARINAVGTVVGTTAPTLTFSNTGAIAFTGSGTRTLTLGGATISDNTFRPQITDGGGATTLSKVDAGLWLINPGASGNTYTGGTSITGGTLAIQAGNALGSGTITINGGGGVGLEIRGGITLGNAITNSTADGGINIASGANTLSGVLTANAQIRFNVETGASATLTHATTSLVGSGTLLKSGGGTLSLSGVNTATGATSVRGGVLELNYSTNNTSKLADAAALTLGGIGAVTVPGVDGAVAGQTKVEGQKGGTIHLTGGSHIEVVSATTIDTGSNAVTRAAGSTAVLRMNAITRSVNQGTIDFGASSIAQTDTNNVNGILGGYATVAKTDWASSIASGAADTAITALATYATDTYASGSNTDITLAAASTGLATLNNSFRFNTNQATTLTIGTAFGVQGTAVGLQSGGILVTPTVGAFDTVITGGPLQVATSTVNLETIIHQHNTAGVLEINSIIQNNTAATNQGLTKTGAGKLILSGLNTFTGNVNLYEGEIQVGGTAAAPTTATNAYLSGLGAASNASAAWNLAIGSTLRFLTTNTTLYNTPTITGDGDLILDAGNLSALLFDDNNDNFYGNITFSGGTIRMATQAQALGNIRGIMTVNNSVNFIFNSAVTSNKLITYNEGTTFNILNNTATSGGAFSGKQTFNNTTTAGLTFYVDAPTTAGTVGLNLTGVVYGTKGFTKTGNGILQITANNFADVYDGYTSINKTPTLSGQIQVNGGVLYVGGTRALGAFGVGNETIVAAGASIDLRGAATNLGDDSSASREIFKIQGTGFMNNNGNATGALRNSTGTGAISFLTLDGHATINSGGQANSSVLQIATFDTNLSNANSLTNAFTRNQPVIAGNGYDLTIVGSRNGTDNLNLLDPSFSSALNSLLIREGTVRVTKETTAPTAFDGLKAADFTNGIVIGYGGQTAADLTGASTGDAGNTAVLGAIVGSRLYLLNQYGLHNTVNITMDGALAATNKGTNTITVDFANIPDGSTYLDGTLTLTGDASRNILQSDSNNNFSVVEQGNTTGTTYSKLVIGGVASGDGGFTKIGAGEVRLTNANTFTGDVNVLRLGTTALPWESHTYKINGIDFATQGMAEGWAEYSLTLNGANGAISGVSNINLQRRGMITMDNTNRLDATSGVVGANNNNRINDAAVINLDHGWLRLNTGTVANTEVLGTVNVNSGTNIIDIYGTDGAGVNTTLTITTLNRTAGAVLRITDLDATSTFGTATTGDSAKVTVDTMNVLQIGGGGAAGTTTRSIVQGVFGGIVPTDLTTDLRVLGFNNGNISDLWNQQRNLQFAAGSDFMTYDGTTLRPLDDSEYFDPESGLINPTTTGATQNINITGVGTIVSQDTTINSLRLGALTDNNGTGATALVDHHLINLYVDGILKISSGMISSAFWTVGNTSSATTSILGGALDFDGREAILNNQNAYYRLTDGTIQGGSFQVQSAITNASGLIKTGFQQVYLDGANTYSGVTTISEGTLFLRNGRSAAGASGAGNGIVINGSGNLSSGNGLVVGTSAAREDIYIGVLAGDQQILRVDNDVTVWNSNLTIDNVDIAGLTSFTPRIRTDNSATSIINGNIGGGNTAITNDIVLTDSRIVQFDSAGNNVFIINGQIGDKLDANGNAIPIADPISSLPTLAGVRTNENEVLRLTLGGGSDETNLILNRNYNAAGRLTISRGTLIANFDPTGSDGSGFWTSAAISKIPNADSTTTSFSVNGNTAHQGFILGSTSNVYAAILLARAGQVFNMASWTMAGTGVKVIGGLNESGIVTFGDGTGTLTAAGATPTTYAADGGTVLFNQRFATNVGTAPANFGFIKTGRGTMELQSTTLATASDSNPVLAGGTLILNYAGQNVARVGDTNVRFEGGTLIALANSAAASTQGLGTSNAANVLVNFNLGGNELVARTVNARNMTLNLGNANANGTTPTSNFTRSLGATANLVEDSTAGGTAQITLQFNATTTAAIKNQVIPWATYGTLSRTATDFAMSDAGASNDVRAYGRALDEYLNNVSTWANGMDVSENGGAGFSGTLAGSRNVSTIRFDANADSVLDLGTNILTVSGTGLASSGGAILVTTNVGAANKTITGTGAAALTTTGGTTELIIHHFGTGNLNVNVPITGANALTIAGPSTTNAASIGTTGAVVLGATNTYTGRTFLNGSVLSFNDVDQLGANPVASTANQITFNGGTLRFSGRGFTSMGNRGFQFDGNGGTIDVVEASGALRTDSIASNTLYRGDLVKVGAGTLIIEGTIAANASFFGLIDVREGTLRVNGDNPGASAGTTSILGSSNSFMDGTIFRTGTNLAIQMGNGNDTANSTWVIPEWLTFEGNNYVTIGTINTQTGVTPAGFPNPNNERQIDLIGVISIKGTTTFDTVPGQTLRLNVSGQGYTTGNGDIVKDGQGALQFQANSPEFTGNIIILQGRVYSVGQADPMGTGYLTGKTITLGSADRQGDAQLSINSDSISGGTHELNHAVNVVYNPAQAKRIYFETFSNGSQIEVNGNITLNDNLNLYINDAAETGGSQNYVNINSKFLDGTTTSGNILFSSDDTGSANDNTNGRVYNYLVLKNDNSGWTGDIRVSTHTSYDQDETAILRLEHTKALTAANDVDMGYNSMLQVGGGARTIGALSTNGGAGPFIGDTAGGAMGAQTNGVTVVIENAATTAGTLTIAQSTPAAVETVWNAYFRNGTLNSEFFAPGVGPVASAALNIVKAGSGWATIATDNGYTGTTLVTGGILQIGRGGVGDTGATTAAGLTANVGTTIAGTGIIQGTTLINGNLRPGDEAGSLMGTLTINGNLTLGATSTTTLQLQRSSYTAFNAVKVQDSSYSTWSSTISTDPTYSHLLNDPVLSSQHDKLFVTGSLTVTTGGKIVLSNAGYNPTAGDVFNVLNWTGAALSGLNLGGYAYNGALLRTGAETGTDLGLFQLGSGYYWDLSQFNSTGALLIVQGASARTLYWNGDQGTVWNTNTAGNTNWSDAAGTTDAGSVPFISDDVIFSSALGANMTTSLGQSFMINSLNFGQGTNTGTSASIDTGIFSLTLSAGINMAVGSAANTISGSTGGVILSADQTWTNNSSNALNVSASVSGTANLTKAGAGLLALSGANSYVGTTTVNAGTLAVANGSAIPDGSAVVMADTAGAVLRLDNDETIGSLAGGGTNGGNVNLQGNTLTTGVAGNTSYAGAISGTGGVTKNGSATTFILSGNSNYTGNTSVDEGAVVVSGSLNGTTAAIAFGATLSVLGTLTTPGIVDVQGTLSGSGMIAGTNPLDADQGKASIGSAGTIAPGATVDGTNSTAALTANTLLTSTGATLKLELGGINAGASVNGYDQIVTSQHIDLATNTTLSLSLLNGYSPAGNLDLLFIIVNTGTSMTAVNSMAFAAQTTATTYDFSPETFNVINVGGQIFAVSYDADSAGGNFHGGNDVALMSVPEPNSLAMLAGSFGLALGLQRFRRRRS